MVIVAAEASVVVIEEAEAPVVVAAEGEGAAEVLLPSQCESSGTSSSANIFITSYSRL